MMAESSSDNNTSFLTDSIVGSILVVFSGGVLGIGVHWQYDLGCTYHSGTKDTPGQGKLSKGQFEQQRAIDLLLLERLVEQKMTQSIQLFGSL
jgi:hypothetical protein